MHSIIDYEKYTNMSERQILNSLLSAQKKKEKIQADLEKKLKNTSELITFLRSKLNEKINSPKYDFIPYENSKSHKIAQAYQDNLAEQERVDLFAEVEADINSRS